MPRALRLAAVLATAAALAVGCAASQRTARRSSTREDPVVAVAGGERIAWSAVVQRARPVLLGHDAPSDAREREVLEREATQRALVALVDERLLRREAARLGLQIADADVDALVAENARARGLSVGQVHDALARAGVGVGEYREIVRSDLVRALLLQAPFSERAAFTDAEIAAEHRRRGQPEPLERVRARLARDLADDETRCLERELAVALRRRYGATFLVATEADPREGTDDGAPSEDYHVPLDGVHVVGDHALPDAELRAAIAQASGGELVPVTATPLGDHGVVSEGVLRAVREVFRTHGFDRAQVAGEREPLPRCRRTLPHAVITVHAGAQHANTGITDRR